MQRHPPSMGRGRGGVHLQAPPPSQGRHPLMNVGPRTGHPGPGGPGGGAPPGGYPPQGHGPPPHPSNVPGPSAPVPIDPRIHELTRQNDGLTRDLDRIKREGADREGGLRQQLDQKIRDLAARDLELDQLKKKLQEAEATMETERSARQYYERYMYGKAQDSLTVKDKDNQAQGGGAPGQYTQANPGGDQQQQAYGAAAQYSQYQGQVDQYKGEGNAYSKSTPQYQQHQQPPNQQQPPGGPGGAMGVYPNQYYGQSQYEQKPPAGTYGNGNNTAPYNDNTNGNGKNGGNWSSQTPGRKTAGPDNTGYSGVPVYGSQSGATSLTPQHNMGGGAPQQFNQGFGSWQGHGNPQPLITGTTPPHKRTADNSHYNANKRARG